MMIVQRTFQSIPEKTNTNLKSEIEIKGPHIQQNSRKKIEQFLLSRKFCFHCWSIEHEKI